MILIVFQCSAYKCLYDVMSVYELLLMSNDVL